MRRRGWDVYAPGAWRPLDDAPGVSPEAIIDALLPHATPSRVAKLRQVIDLRVEAVTVLMDAPHDPHNGAAMLRTLDVFGVQDLWVVERNEPFLAAATVSRGSQKWIDVHSFARVDEPVGALRARGYELVATHPEGELLPGDLRGIERLCLVLGNERDGISDALRASCGRAVRVPMRGFAESLNVSATAAILLQAATFGRPGDLGEARKRELLASGLMMSNVHALDVLRASGLIG